MSDPQIQNPIPPERPPGKLKAFVKELLSGAPVRIVIPKPDGSQNLFQVPWENIGDDTGLYMTEDAAVISALRRMEAARKSGIREIPADSVEALKKVASVQEQRRDSLRQRSLLGEFRIVPKNFDGNAAADKPAGIEYPDPANAAEVSTQVITSTAEAPNPVENRTPKPRKARKPVAPITVPEDAPPVVPRSEESVEQ